MSANGDLDFGSPKELPPPRHIDATFLPAWRALEAERAKLAKAVPKLNKAVAETKRESEAATRRMRSAADKRSDAQRTFDKLQQHMKALVGP